MRIALVVLLIGCGGAATTGPAGPPERDLEPPVHRAAEADAVPADPIAALAPPADGAATSWLAPGLVRFDLVGQALADAAVAPVEVTVFDRHGDAVRAAVRTDRVRFAVWARARDLLPVVVREQRVSPFAGGGGGAGGEIDVALRPGAAVRRLERKDRWTRVRYLGRVEVEGWIPDDALGEQAAVAGPRGAMTFAGEPSVTVLPGAAIREQTQWTSRKLAVIASGYLVSPIRKIDDAWSEVAYEDAEVRVRGFLSRRDPPERVHGWRETAAIAPAAITANAQVPAGACLYAAVEGEAIGTVVDGSGVQLDDAGRGWWTLAIDTPWGAVTFYARGPAAAQLERCATNP